MSRVRVVSWVLALAVGGCATPHVAPPKTPPRTTKLHPAEVKPSLDGPDAPPIDAFRIGATESTAVPAATARRGTDSVTVFSRENHLRSRRVDVKTGPVGDEIDLGPHAPLGDSGIKLVTTQSGYALLWDEQIEGTQVLKVVGLDATGKASAPPYAMAPISDKVSYASLLAFDGGLLLVHDVERAGVSDVYVTPLDPEGKRALSAPTVVAHDVQGWDCAASAREAVFAVVAQASGKKSEGEPLGPVRTFTVDAAGKKSPEIHVLDQDASDIDVQVAPIDGGAAVAFTDHTEMEGVVKFAFVKNGALAVAPKRVSPPLGDAAFVEIVASPRGAGQTALVTWESIGESGDELRLLHYGVVGSDGRITSAMGRFIVDRTAQPHIVADGDGYAFLTLAPSKLAAAPPPAGDAKPELPPAWPSFIRVDHDLTVRASEPLRFYGTHAKDGVPDTTFGLACDAGECSALATSDGTPTDLFLAVLPARTSPWQPVAWRDTAETKPGVRTARSLVVGPELTKVASAKLPRGGNILTAWTTYFVDGASEVETPPKGEPPYAATLATRIVHEDGSLGDPVVLSKRATSDGGVAIATMPNAGDAVVAWVASERGSAQVYATRIDADGKKSAQKKLTVLERKKSADGVNGASGVAIAYAPPNDAAKKKGTKDGGDGFVVGWIDTRDKNGEVYAARLNHELDKVVIDKRVTNAPGDASDVDVLVHGNDVWMAYADGRDGASADIYLARLDLETLRVKDEGRLYASHSRSHAPKLALAGDQLLVAWIEDAADGAATPAGATARVAELDASGHLLASPFVIEAPKPPPGVASATGIASLAFTCGGSGVDTCRVAFAASLDQGQVLYGLTLGKDGAPGAPGRIAALNTAALTDTSLGFADPTAADVTLVEQGSAGRARELHLDW